jgi:hypothetical protein
MIEQGAVAVDYRKLAFDIYPHLCAHCGWGGDKVMNELLEVAHIDGDHSNSEISNLVILCPNCHKMLDLDLIPTEVIIEMRDRPKVAAWGKRMKDAGAKAGRTRRLHNIALKAVDTRRRRQAERLHGPDQH